MLSDLLPGETLSGQVQVTANGNQRFTVEVTLTIAGRPPSPRMKVVEMIDAVPPLVAVEIPIAPESANEGDYRKRPPRRRPT